MALSTGHKIAIGVGATAILGLAVGIGVAATRKSGPSLGLGRAIMRKQIKSGDVVVTTFRAKRDIPIAKRVAIIQDLIHESVAGAPAAKIRKLALSITSNCPARDGRCESYAIYDWVRRNIRYTGDIAPHKLGSKGPYEPIDLFQRADRTIEFGGGDCDDHSILVASLGIANGIQAKVRVSSKTQQNVEDYSHIYPLLGLPKMRPQKWIVADTTLPGNYFGIEAPHGKHLDFAA